MIDDNLTTWAKRANSRTPLRIFLVEDSEDVRDLIVESIAEIAGVALAGYAETESDALRQLRDQTYDVLVLDIQLQEGNGMSLLQSLARSGLSRQDEIKVVFSNHVSPTYRRVGKQCGVQHFFDKSSELPLLCELLEKLARDKIGVPSYASSSMPPTPAQTDGR